MERREQVLLVEEEEVLVRAVLAVLQMDEWWLLHAVPCLEASNTSRETCCSKNRVSCSGPMSSNGGFYGVETRFARESDQIQGAHLSCVEDSL